MKTTNLTVTETNNDGHKIITCKNKAKRLHNPYGAAYVYYLNNKIQNKIFYLNGKLHREDGPAIIYYYDNGQILSEHYFLNGKHHREDGHTIIYYYQNGKIEREFYYLNDKRHRENGPAYIHYHKNGKIDYEEYYLNNKNCYKQDLDRKINKKTITSCEGKIVEIDGRKYKLTTI